MAISNEGLDPADLTKGVPIALVTGGGSGIGRASATALARLGAHVVVADRNLAGAVETVALIGADVESLDAGGAAEAVELDVRDAVGVAALIDDIVARHGRLDWAHNNAGVFSSAASFVDVSDDDFDLLMGINFKGVWLCMRAELAVMARQGRGSIVNTSSAAGMIGTPKTPGYSASKHAVLGLTRSAAREYADQGIRVNAVCPGSVRTPMVTANLVNNPEILQHIMQMQPSHRMAEPEEIAASVAWLCSDAASYVSGAGLLVAGAAVNR
jgi:NAD(P)-dependent dehydrogenase (short-subunit alcohol dehydrogenase family)